MSAVGGGAVIPAGQAEPPVGIDVGSAVGDRELSPVATNVKVIVVVPAVPGFWGMYSSAWLMTQLVIPLAHGCGP